MVGDCTHHDRSKDLLVVLNIEPKKLRVAVQRMSSTWPGYLVVEDRQYWKRPTEHYSSGWGIEW